MESAEIIEYGHFMIGRVDMLFCPFRPGLSFGNGLVRVFVDNEVFQKIYLTYPYKPLTEWQLNGMFDRLKEFIYSKDTLKFNNDVLAVEEFYKLNS